MIRVYFVVNNRSCLLFKIKSNSYFVLYKSAGPRIAVNCCNKITKLSGTQANGSCHPVGGEGSDSMTQGLLYITRAPPTSREHTWYTWCKYDFAELLDSSTEVPRINTRILWWKEQRIRSIWSVGLFFVLLWSCIFHFSVSNFEFYNLNKKASFSKPTGSLYQRYCCCLCFSNYTYQRKNEK